MRFARQRLPLALLLLVTSIAAPDELEVRLFQKVGGSDPAAVLIPRSDLRRLSEKAPDSTSSPPAPGTCMLQTADYRVVPGYPAARVEATFRARCSGEGWVPVELAGRAASLVSPAKCSPAATILPAGAPGRFVVRGEGDIEIVQELSAPVAKDGNRFRLRLGVPVVPVDRLRVSLEATPASARFRDFKVSPGHLAASSLAGGFPATSVVTLEWSNARPLSESGAGEPGAGPEAGRSQITAAWHLLGKLSERSVRIEGSLTLAIDDRPTMQTAIDLPAGLAVVDARAPGLADWSVAQVATGQRLTIEWRAPTNGRIRLALVLEAAREAEGKKAPSDESRGGGPKEPFEIGLPAVSGATRETVWLGLSAPGHIDAEVRRMSEGVRLVDPDQVPRELRLSAEQPLALLFMASRSGDAAPRLIAIEVARHEQVAVLSAVADLAEVSTHVALDGSVLGRVRYLVKNNAEQFLRVRLPDGARVLSSFVSETAVSPGQAGAGGEILVPLEKSGVQNTQAAAFPVEVTWLETREPFAEGESVRFTLPSVQLPVSTLRWKLALPRDLEAHPIRTNLSADASYREVAYAGDSGDADSRARGSRLFEKIAPPLAVPFPEGSHVDHYSQDILEPGSAAPYLEARLVARQTGRPQRTLAFAVALLIAFWLVLAGPTFVSRRQRTIALLVISGSAVGATSFRPEFLALGLYFALGLFLGVAIALLRWGAEWRPVSERAPEPATVPAGPPDAPAAAVA